MYGTSISVAECAQARLDLLASEWGDRAESMAVVGLPQGVAEG
jgi:hypothetical protein